MAISVAWLTQALVSKEAELRALAKENSELKMQVAGLQAATGPSALATTIGVVPEEPIDPRMEQYAMVRYDLPQAEVAEAATCLAKLAMKQREDFGARQYELEHVVNELTRPATGLSLFGNSWEDWSRLVDHNQYHYQCEPYNDKQTKEDVMFESVVRQPQLYGFRAPQQLPVWCEVKWDPNLEPASNTTMHLLTVVFTHPVGKDHRAFTLLVDALTKSGVYKMPYTQYLAERNAQIQAAKSAPQYKSEYEPFDPTKHRPQDQIPWMSEGGTQFVRKQQAPPTSAQQLQGKLLQGEGLRREERNKGIYPVKL